MSESDPGDAERRAHVRAALERHGVGSGQAAALAKSLLDLVTVIGADGCRAAFGAALGSDAPSRPGAPQPDAATAVVPAPIEADDVSRLLGRFAGELRRLDDALQRLGREIARAAAGPTPKDPRALH